MARALGSKVDCFISTDKDGNPVSPVLWTYTVEDGAAKKKGTWSDESPDFTKTFHNTGAVGEFWRDAVDTIKTNEGI